MEEKRILGMWNGVLDFRKLVHVTYIFIKFQLREHKPPFYAIQYSIRIMEIIYCVYFNGLSNPDVLQ